MRSQGWWEVAGLTLHDYGMDAKWEDLLAEAEKRGLNPRYAEFWRWRRHGKKGRKAVFARRIEF